ncbi:MAG TPA: PAS domain S-box protein [Polyangiaceae bacterium]|nr:PAS domain S-box protein [Polyangiaceae bacterium]
MSRSGEQNWTASVAAALAGADPDASWAAALAILSQAGIQAPARGATPDFVIEAHGQRAAFSRGGRALEPEALQLLQSMLRAGMARVAEAEQHRRLHERLEMLSSASFEGLLMHEDGSVIDCNARLAEMLGYAPEELLGRNLIECVDEADLPMVRQRLAERFEGAYLVTAVRKDGSRFRAELLAKQGKLGARPVRVVAVRDVTERERASASLRESEARLRELALRAFDCIVFSRNGVVLAVDGAVERVMGYSAEEVVGRKVVEFVAPSSVPLANRVLGGQLTGTYESSVIHRSGSYVPVELLAFTTTLDGEPVRMTGARDLRNARRLDQERRRLEEQLQRSQRLESLGVLAGGVAHDFNNLLVGMLGNAELLQDSLREPDDVELCQAITRAAQRAADLTAQLLAYAGRRDLGARQGVDLATLWRELSSLLAARLSRRAQIELRLAPDSLVLGDRAGLTQMFMNLLTNASDALEDRPGLIEITTTHVSEPDARWDHALGAPVGPGNWVMTEVRDTGVGMDEQTLLRVFEPFFSTKEKGHGLGLASCLGIVSAHGGALSVESAPGAGSRFSVLLPAASQLASVAPAGRSSAAAKGRVLVIDDESVVRALLRRSLERRGYTVEEATGGKAGLEAIAGQPADLIVLDMTMPEVDGAEVVRRVRARGLDVPILLISGNVDPALERRLEPGSFQAFLRKPFSIAELIATIDGLIVPDRAASAG